MPFPGQLAAKGMNNSLRCLLSAHLQVMEPVAVWYGVSRLAQEELEDPQITGGLSTVRLSLGH